MFINYTKRSTLDLIAVSSCSSLHESQRYSEVVNFLETNVEAYPKIESPLFFYQNKHQGKNEQLYRDL
jgi:hypothetical protein